MTGKKEKRKLRHFGNNFIDKNRKRLVKYYLRDLVIYLLLV